MSAPTSPKATEWTVFAACLMIFGGVMASLEGIAAVVNSNRYIITWDYVYKFDISSWGWLHMSLGILVLLAGIAQFTGATWARWTGVAIVGASMIAHFVWLPYVPFWSIILIGIDIFIIWALTGGAHHHEDAKATAS